MPVQPFYIPRHPAPCRPAPVAPWAAPEVAPTFIPEVVIRPVITWPEPRRFAFLPVAAWAVPAPVVEPDFVPVARRAAQLTAAQPARVPSPSVASWAVPEIPPDFVPERIVPPVVLSPAPRQLAAPSVASWAASAGTPNHQITVGSGYSDVSGKQLVRTSGNRVYLTASDCSAYPCDAAAQTIRVYRADQTAAPSSFTRSDSAHEPAGVAGWSAAIDGNDVIHIAWTFRAVNGAALDGLRYTTYSTATDLWSATVETIISGGLTDGVGQGVQTVSLAVDSNGVPHLTYLSGNGIARRIYYRNRVGGVWSAATQVDDTVTYAGNERAWHPNLGFDNTGRILFAWLRGSFNGDNDGTVFSRVRQTSGSFDAVVNVSGTAAARTSIDQGTSLMVTGTNRYHLVWIQQPNDYIRYSYSEDIGATWSANNPGGGTQATHDPSLGPNGAGGARIYGHGTPNPAPDGHGDNLYYFEGDGGTATWGAWTLYDTNADVDSSVNTRWSQYFWNFPTYLDIIYWNDTYPNNLYYGVDIGAGVAVYPAPRSLSPVIRAPEPRAPVASTIATWALPPPPAGEPDFVPVVRRFPMTAGAAPAPFRLAPIAAWAAPDIPLDFAPRVRYRPPLAYGTVAPYAFPPVASWALPEPPPDLVPQVRHWPPIAYGAVAPYAFLPVASWAPVAAEKRHPRSRVGAQLARGRSGGYTGSSSRAGGHRP